VDRFLADDKIDPLITRNMLTHPKYTNQTTGLKLEIDIFRESIPES
jgi:hypothetical protein